MDLHSWWGLELSKKWSCVASTEMFCYSLLSEWGLELFERPLFNLNAKKDKLLQTGYNSESGSNRCRRGLSHKQKNDRKQIIIMTTVIEDRLSSSQRSVGLGILEQCRKLSAIFGIQEVSQKWQLLWNYYGSVIIDGITRFLLLFSVFCLFSGHQVKCDEFYCSWYLKQAAKL